MLTKMRRLICLAVLATGCGLPFAAFADAAGDLVFTERGPWNLKDAPVVWSLNIAGPPKAQFRQIKDGQISLIETTDPSDGKAMLQLVEKNPDPNSPLPERKVGPFPADSGDPSVVFFLETVARDMAAATGGSPFYIRNRMKDAVFRGGEIRQEADQQVAVFRPFANDPNKDRMAPFDQLELNFVIRDPKAPIHAMSATTGGESPAFLFSMEQP